MRGLMMDQPLLISSIITHAARWNGDVEVVSRSVEGPIVRHTYREVAARSAQLAHALQGLGLAEGDRVASLAWNTHRHVELYYGVSGIGAILHTINPRLHPSQIAYIVNHAADVYLFVDLTFLPILEAIAAHLPTIRGYIVLTDEAHMPKTALPNALCYETLLKAYPEEIAWPQFDERTASSLCYTSGTTGEPKGVLYSHRSTILHTFSGGSVEHSPRPEPNRCVMPVVPMFHVNGWGYPYTAPMGGTKLVLPGPGYEGAQLYELMESERVTSSAGVPVIWLRLLQYLNETGKELTWLQCLRVGGSASPPSLIEAFEKRGIEVAQGWGMTETSPVCTTGALKTDHRNSADRLQYQLTAGRIVFGVDMKIVDADENELPRDGEAQGELCVRGPWVTSGYYNSPAATGHAFTKDGWFRTGDVCSLDPEGYLTVHDRAKDLITSGGEWISSIDLENAAIDHPEIEEAAAIAVPHAQWGERPMLVIRRRAGSELDHATVVAFLAPKVASWWLPDEIVFVEELPYTATGKVSKKTLRERFIPA